MFFAVDQRVYVVRGEFNVVSVGDGVRRASVNAVAAEDAAGIVNVVDASVPFTGRNTLYVSIFRSFDVDASRRAGCRTQEASNALFQSVFIPVENVNAAVTRLEMDGFFGIIFCDGFP